MAFCPIKGLPPGKKQDIEQINITLDNITSALKTAWNLLWNCTLVDFRTENKWDNEVISESDMKKICLNIFHHWIHH